MSNIAKEGKKIEKMATLPSCATFFSADKWEGMANLPYFIMGIVEICYLGGGAKRVGARGII